MHLFWGTYVHAYIHICIYFGVQAGYAVSVWQDKSLVNLFSLALFVSTNVPILNRVVNCQI